jgi:hypothetical protein
LQGLENFGGQIVRVPFIEDENLIGIGEYP